MRRKKRQNKYYQYKFYLYFMNTLLGYLGLAYVAVKGALYFYPQEEKRESASTQTVQVDTSTTPKVNADTEYLVQYISRTDGTVEAQKSMLPRHYLGMTREQLEEQVRLESAALSLEERRKGVEHTELASFSNKRVVIAKYVQVPEEKSFYLLAKNHYVSVYKADRISCIQDTNILLADLPDQLQQQIIKGKYIEDQKMLYHFLETYTS